MFGGGEEFFQPPPSIDRDTLRHYATFCARLRALKVPSKKAINEVASAAHEVGDNPQAYELVIGAIFRHIKSWTDNKQLACWYVLDKLCKEERDKYGYTASRYILEIGRDHIPYENPALAAKYESLVEHWESVFPRHVVDALWLAKKERLWAVEHPAELAQQQQQEEEEWTRVQRAMDDEDGLNHFGQPCMDYLQGRCTWGDQCRLYHPPGEEGSLPLECRMGDWKCAACGVINRHYRRRCSNCVREKPQYKQDSRGVVVVAEDKLLSQPDPAVQSVLRQQFGYNPYRVDEALAHWRVRLEHTTLSDYLSERRAAYRVRILHRPPADALEERCRTQRHYPDVDIDGEEEDSNEDVDEEEGEQASASRRKRVRQESVVPAGTPPPTAVALTAQLILERGMRDGMVGQLLSELARHMRAVAAGKMVLSAQQAEAMMSAIKLAYTAWNTNSTAVPFVAVFFRAVRYLEDHIGLSDAMQEDLVSMTTHFVI